MKSTIIAIFTLFQFLFGVNHNFCFVFIFSLFCFICWGSKRFRNPYKCELQYEYNINQVNNLCFFYI